MKRRSAFTLIEVLVVIAILLALTVFVVSAFQFDRTEANLREAGRIGQSAFMGAKDRALHAGERRGIRLLRDSSDPTLANGFAFVTPVDPQKYGAVFPVNGAPIQVEMSPTVPPEAVIVRGVGVDWHFLSQQGFFPFPARIRIPAVSGQWYTIVTGSVVLVTPATNECTLQLTTPFVGGAIPPTDPQATCEIEVGNELLPHHAPIVLPSGIVIDLKWSSQNVQTAWAWTPTIINTDVMFTPRGNITGPITAGGPLYFLLRDIGDATANLNPIAADAKPSSVLAVVPMTGHVQSYPIDPHDEFNNATGAPGPDGLADDLFRYARLR